MSNAEYQASVHTKLRQIQDKIIDRLEGPDNLSYAQDQRDIGYLHCLNVILSYGELPKMYLDRISKTLDKMEQ